jgi:hypothetical protein
MSTELESRIAKLEARVQELEDEREIRELLSRYGFNADCRRDDKYVDLYTDDGVVDLGEGGAGRGRPFRWEGKEAIRQFIADPEGHHREDVYGRSMHLQGNNVVTHIQGDEALVNSYSIALTASPDLRMLTAGNNLWRLKKIDGKWLFQERRRRVLGSEDYIANVDDTPE